MVRQLRIYFIRDCTPCNARVVFKENFKYQALWKKKKKTFYKLTLKKKKSIERPFTITQMPLHSQNYFT